MNFSFRIKKLERGFKVRIKILLIKFLLSFKNNVEFMYLQLKKNAVILKHLIHYSCQALLFQEETSVLFAYIIPIKSMCG